MIKLLESMGSGRSLVWKSVVPATVYFTCADAEWKAEANLTDEIKQKLLSEAVEWVEEDSFLYIAPETENGTSVEFNVKNIYSIEFENDNTFASKEVIMDIVYKGRIDLNFDMADDPEQVKEALKAQMEDLGDAVWPWFHDQNGFNPAKDDPETFAPYMKSAYCAVTNGTSYSKGGWGEWFSYAPDQGDILVNGKEEYDFFRDLETVEE